MAFPTIATADTKNGTQASNSSSWTGTYPTNLVSGDLIVLFVGADGGGQVNSLPAGWVIKVSAASAAIACSVCAKISTGSETGSFTIGLAASEQGGWRCFRINAASWYGSSLGTDNTDDGLGFSALQVGSGSSANPDNSSSADPANWGTEDTLWFVALSVDTSRTISVFPYASNNSSDVSGGAGGATLGLCTTTSASSTLDPGAWTISAADDFMEHIAAVRPSGARVPRNSAINHQNPAVV